MDAGVGFFKYRIAGRELNIFLETGNQE